MAALAAPARTTPADERAWPVWRAALFDCTVLDRPGWRWEPEVFREVPIAWPAQAGWLRAHADGLAVARRAAALPRLGFVVGPGGSGDDPALFGHTPSESAGEPVDAVRLPHLNALRAVAVELAADGRLAVESEDGGRVVADILALHRMADQLRRDGVDLPSDQVALGVDWLAVDRLGRVLATRPGVLSDRDLVEMAHTLSGPRVAADLISLGGERASFADAVQRMYTDDAHGDGRFTWSGLRQLGLYATVYWTGGPYEQSPRVSDAAAVLPFAVGSRSAVTAAYEAFMGRVAANLARPRRAADWPALDGQVREWRASAVDRVRYAALLPFVTLDAWMRSSPERYLGDRDGLLVGLALEAYHRRHGRYPAALAELVPDLLPGVPADRITGDPVRYRLVDGRPVVYSVAADRVDDVGRPAAGRGPSDAAVWDVSPARAPRGDWVLYPPGRD